MIRKHKSPHGRITAVSMMKDEGPFVLEWIAHHLSLGFTDIVVYTNDCTDGTDKMLIRLEEMGLAHHRVNDIPEGRRPQPSAIKYAQDEPIVRESDWVLVFDADEFLCIKQGDGTLDGLISSVGDANGIVITWRLFGSGGVVDWSREPVTEQYTRAAPSEWNKGWGVKTLFKFDHNYWKLGIHRPSIKNKHLDTGFPDTVKWVNGSGQPMEDYFKFRGWRSIRRTVGYEWAQMNHYAVKSIDSYALRKFRGNVNLKKDKYNSDYWSLQDRNEVVEKSALRHSEKRAAIFEELLKDTVLRGLHETALERVEKRLAEFKSTKDYEDLKADLIQASKVPITAVEAKPPKARDAAKIAALMSEVERNSNARAKKSRKELPAAKARSPGLGTEEIYVEGDIELSSNDEIEFVPNHEIPLPLDAQIFKLPALELVQSGKFERRNARQIQHLVSSADRFLEIGAGIGFIPAVLKEKLPGLEILALEDRAGLVEAARLVSSKLGHTEKDSFTLDSAPVFGGNAQQSADALQRVLSGFRPTVLRICDSRVTEAVIANLDLGKIRRIIRPHPHLASAPVVPDPVCEAVMAHGFVLSEEYSTDCSVVLDRP